MMASINLVMVSQSNIFNRDFVIDHKLSVELWSSEFLDQSDTYNLCFLNIAFTVRKCPSHICNDFSFNYTNAFVWMRHTLDWHKWTCSRKAKTAPEHLLAMFYITHWYGQDFTAHPFDPDKSTVLPLNEKMTFIWKQHFFTVFYNPILCFFSLLSFLFHFVELEAAFQWFLSLSARLQWAGSHLYLSICELQHASNPSVNPSSSSVHIFCYFQRLFGYSLSVA